MMMRPRAGQPLIVRVITGAGERAIVQLHDVIPINRGNRVRLHNYLHLQKSIQIKAKNIELCTDFSFI